MGYEDGRAVFEVECGRVRGQGRPRFAGHAYKTKPDREWEALIAREYEGQCADGDGRVPVFHGPVGVRIDVHGRLPQRERVPSPHTGKPDCDNVAKAVLDALTGVAWDDDSQVVELVVKKWNRTPRETELMGVSVWEVK